MPRPRGGQELGTFEQLKGGCCSWVEREKVVETEAGEAAGKGEVKSQVQWEESGEFCHVPRRPLKFILQSQKIIVSDLFFVQQMIP